jgi:hypothetical protein
VEKPFFKHSQWRKDIVSRFTIEDSRFTQWRGNGLAACEIAKEM